MPGGWPDAIVKLVNDTDTLIRGTIVTLKPLPRWYRGRAVLVGDAAHAVSPHSGQGASLALEDAMYLAKTLRLALKDVSEGEGEGEGGVVLSKQKIEEAFQVYQDARKERGELVVEEGKKRGEPARQLWVKGKDGDEEKPPGMLGQWCIDMMVKAIFSFFVPSGFKKLVGYVIEWDDCQSLEELRQKVAAQKKREKAWW